MYCSNLLVLFCIPVSSWLSVSLSFSLSVFLTMCSLFISCHSLWASSLLLYSLTATLIYSILTFLFTLCNYCLPPTFTSFALISISLHANVRENVYNNSKNVKVMYLDFKKRKKNFKTYITGHLITQPLIHYAKSQYR